MYDVVTKGVSIFRGQGPRAYSFQFAAMRARHPAPKDVVLSTRIDPDYRPHLMIVGHDCHMRRPNHVQDRQIARMVEFLDQRLLTKSFP
jgi:hypothetical protein